MCILSNPIASEYENIEPCSQFQKTWQVLNNGTEDWPVGCHFICASGDKFGTGPVQVPALQPGQGSGIVVTMQSPSIPGIYQSKFRMCTPAGSFFGGKDVNLTII